MTSDTQPQPQASASATPTPTPPRTALDFNLPKGDNFLVNSRGQRLHVRTFLPAAGKGEGGGEGGVKALLVWSHGYAAHVNGPTVAKVMAGMNENGFAVIAIDHHGHGYSDGKTVLITDYKHLVDDSMTLLDIIDNGTPDGDESHLGMDADLRERLRTLPFFLGGQSMGGGLALMLGMHLASDDTREGIAGRFVGVMANCPAIIANPPPKPVLLVLKHIIAPMFPAMQLPSFMEKVSVPELVWNSDEYKEMGALDKVGKPGGLGWPGTMRLSTGSQLLDMLGSIQSRLAEVNFPFLVMHDPEDGVVRFEGTEMLLKEATTPTHIPRGKELKEMLGMKHDLLSNASQEMVDTYVDWAGARLEARTNEKA